MKEHQIQESFIVWLHIQHPDVVHNHSPNEGNRKPWYVVFLKKMGMWPGWPDLEFLLGKQMHFMEFKTPKGRMRDNQKAFQSHCLDNDIPHAVVRSLEEAIQVFNNWHKSALAQTPRHSITTGV